MKAKILIIALLIANISSAQVGIGIENPEASFDVNVKTQFSNLPDARGNIAKYDRVLYANNDGDIGYRTRGTSNYFYRNSYFKTMTKGIKATTFTNLDLSISILIPPYAKQLVELNYSIGVFNGGPGNASVFLARVGDLGNQVLYNSTRTFSFVSNYAGDASARGRAISNTYFDEVQNTTSVPKLVTYQVFGMKTGSASTFGMWADVGGGNNFNWGRGSLNINVFDYD